MIRAFIFLLFSIVLACCLFKTEEPPKTIKLVLVNFMEVDPQKNTTLAFLDDKKEMRWFLVENRVGFDFNIIKGKTIKFNVDPKTGYVIIKTDELEKRYKKNDR